MSVIGIKETQEALVAGLKIAEIAKSALADGKIGIGDLGLVMPVISQLNLAIDGSHKIPSELSDLQEGEYDQLVAVAAPYIKDLAPDAIEGVIFTSLGIVKGLLDLVGVLK